MKPSNLRKNRLRSSDSVKALFLSVGSLSQILKNLICFEAELGTGCRKRILSLFLATFSLGACHPQVKNALEVGENIKTPGMGIIGGENADFKNFPYMANIWLTSSEELYDGHLCGGSLIAPQWVLTAAHCVLQDVSDSSRKTVARNGLKVHFDSPSISGAGGVSRTVVDIQIHPKFSWLKYDLALLKLDHPIADRKPITLPKNSDFRGMVSIPGWALGWGLVDEAGREESKTLKQISLPLLPLLACNQDPFVIKRKWNLGEETLCASTNLNQTATCHGDSGGPLLQKIDGEDVQIGVISWGSACHQPLAGELISNVEGYSSVAAGLSWIHEVLQSAKP